MKSLRIVFLVPLLVTPAFALMFGKYRPSNDVKQASGTITEEGLKGHIRFLSDDLLEGRGPGSKGDLLAQKYIASQFEALGLKPANGESWFQKFGLVGITSFPQPAIQISRGANKGVTLRYSRDYIASSGLQKGRVAVTNAELVFVGYGIQAPEYQWDDFKDVDVKGKVLVVMNNDPADDPALFAGKTRLYYGRWTYKYEKAAEMGAAGAIIIHTQESAGYPWQVVQTSWSGEQFELPYEGGPTLRFPAWMTNEAAKKVFSLGGKNLDELRAAAQKKDFRPVPLGVRLTVQIPYKVRKVETANVLGILPGSDPELSKEAVLYMAHHDHLGKNAKAKKGEDAIFNGALDNASGVAGLLSIAKAYSTLGERPARSILFAAVGAEEQGLLGSEYFAKHPTLPAGRIAAAINMDGIGIWGKATDLTFIGKGKSTLDPIVDSIAAMQGRTVRSDQFPDRGFFYRSDQFNLAKIGVPAAYFDSGVEIIGKPAGWGKEQIEKWESTHYHQPSDEMTPEWDLSGAVQDLQLNFFLGQEVASRKELPEWIPGDEFEAARKSALQALTATK